MNPEPTKTEDRSIVYGTVFYWTAGPLRLRGDTEAKPLPTGVSRARVSA